MQNKDANRLSVLRSLLSQTLNASKTSNPINTDRAADRGGHVVAAGAGSAAVVQRHYSGGRW